MLLYGAQGAALTLTQMFLGFLQNDIGIASKERAGLSQEIICFEFVDSLQEWQSIVVSMVTEKPPILDNFISQFFILFQLTANGPSTPTIVCRELRVLILISRGKQVCYFISKHFGCQPIHEKWQCIESWEEMDCQSILS